MSKTKDKTSISIAAILSTTLIGFCALIITLIITRLPQAGEVDGLAYILGFFVAALIFFMSSTDFYILAAWKEDKYETCGTIGSLVYGLGEGWLIIGISLTLRFLTPFIQLAYFTLVMYLLAHIMYYTVRSKIITSKIKEPFPKSRKIVRSLVVIQILSGIFILMCL